MENLSSLYPHSAVPSEFAAANDGAAQGGSGLRPWYSPGIYPGLVSSPADRSAYIRQKPLPSVSMSSPIWPTAWFIS